MKTILKTLIAALVLFVGYNLFLRYAHPVPGPGQQQWQKNTILMQDYVDYHQGDPVVIVGTSLSARLYNSILPKGYYNLSLAGGSIYEGLSVIMHTPKKPKYLFIESNIFYKYLDKDAIANVFDPFSEKLRKTIPSFREENQPANLITPLLSKTPKNPNTGPSTADADIRNMLLKERIKEYQTVPANDDMTINLKLLKSYINGLQSQGIKVVLYEIPMNCALYATPRYAVPKKIITDALPASEYKWMEKADCAAYQYADGSHMELGSAGDFVKWFVGEATIEMAK